MLKKSWLVSAALSIFGMHSSNVLAVEAPVLADANTWGPTAPGPALWTLLRVSATSSAYLDFDLSTLPSGTTGSKIAKASLLLWVSRSTITQGTLDVLPVTSAWTEADFSASSPPAVGSNVVAQVPVTASGRYVVVDVTELVKTWVDYPAQKFGLALVATAGLASSFVEFDSKENATTSHGPKLDIVLVSEGAPGETGAMGPTGPEGPQGIAGPKGDKGDTGAPGVVGAAGPAGPAGAIGLTGPIGPAGADGAQGIAGLPGAVGPVGPAGLAGAVGATGPVGPQGPAGAPGVQGAPGMKGEKGEAGVALVPVVVPNATCNGAIDTVGITADRKTLLSCQSGSWDVQAPNGVPAFSLSQLSGRQTIAFAFPGYMFDRYRVRRVDTSYYLDYREGASGSWSQWCNLSTYSPGNAVCWTDGNFYAFVSMAGVHVYANGGRPAFYAWQ